ncbi:hypothetical protein Tco_0339797 [Tanacetum coccineum]
MPLGGEGGEVVDRVELIRRREMKKVLVRVNLVGEEGVRWLEKSRLWGYEMQVMLTRDDRGVYGGSLRSVCDRGSVSIRRTKDRIAKPALLTLLLSQLLDELLLTLCEVFLDMETYGPVGIVFWFTWAILISPGRVYVLGGACEIELSYWNGTLSHVNLLPSGVLLYKHHDLH